MSFILPYIEYYLGVALSGQRGRDTQLFVRRAPFTLQPNPSLEVTSPELGASDAELTVDHTQFGASRFPRISWTAPAGKTAKEYVLIVEDADSPMAEPSLHGIYWKIPASKTEVGPEDFELESEGERGEKFLKGGFRLAKNRRGNLYTGPRPICGHGVHRYFFQVVALSEELDPEALDSVPSRLEIEDAVTNKVVGWGWWIGKYERKWQS